MVVMDETVVVLMITALWFMAAYIAYQKLFVVRKLRKQIDGLTQSALDAARSVPHSAPDADSGIDVKRLQQRLEVLERIAVEKEDSLSRQIDELRLASR